MGEIFKGVVHLPSQEAYEALMKNGTLETNAGTITYSPTDTIYTTPDNSAKLEDLPTITVIPQES